MKFKDAIKKSKRSRSNRMAEKHNQSIDSDTYDAQMESIKKFEKESFDDRLLRKLDNFNEIIRHKDFTPKVSLRVEGLFPGFVIGVLVTYLIMIIANV